MSVSRDGDDGERVEEVREVRGDGRGEGGVDVDVDVDHDVSLREGVSWGRKVCMLILWTTNERSTNRSVCVCVFFDKAESTYCPRVLIFDHKCECRD